MSGENNLTKIRHCAEEKKRFEIGKQSGVFVVLIVLPTATPILIYPSVI